MMDFPPPTGSEVLRAWLDELPAVIENARPADSFQVQIFLSGTNLATSTGGEAAYRAAWVGDIVLPLPGSLSRGLAADLEPLGRPVLFLRSTE